LLTALQLVDDPANVYVVNAVPLLDTCVCPEEPIDIKNRVERSRFLIIRWFLFFIGWIRNARYIALGDFASIYGKIK
jgi:hypothetical protein